MKILKTYDFTIWYDNQPLKIRFQIDGRLQRITDNDYLGHVKKLDDHTFELKFNNGNRIYFTKKGSQIIILLAGGNKNSQPKDIKKSIKLARKVHENE